MRASASRNAVQPSALAPPPGTMMWLRPFGLFRRAPAAPVTNPSHDMGSPSAMPRPDSRGQGDAQPASPCARQAVSTARALALFVRVQRTPAAPRLGRVSQQEYRWEVHRKGGWGSGVPTRRRSRRCAGSGPRGLTRWTRRRPCCPRGTPWLSPACHRAHAGVRIALEGQYGPRCPVLHGMHIAQYGPPECAPQSLRQPSGALDRYT